MSLKLNHFLSRSQSLKTSTHRLFSSSYVPTPIFNQELKTKHREFVYNKFKDTNYYEYLREESARKLVDRLEDINRSFPHALEIGNYRGQLLDIIDSAESLRGDKGGIGGVQTLVQTSTFPQSNSKTMNPDITRLGLVKPEQILCNDETLPFPDNSFDLVMSNLYLHWVNDLPKALKEIQRVLKPDGAFIASVLGGKTLEELSHSLYLGEMERRGHVRPHTSPLILASDVAGLVQSTPFALPTIDVETINVSYPDAFSLMEHISYMGESMATNKRQMTLGKDSLLASASIYQCLHGLDDNSVQASFEFIYLIGWKPSDDQPKPCQRGSAQRSLKDELKPINAKNE